jgi:hypothetical protein
VRFCSDKPKVLVIGKQFSGGFEQTERPGVSKTKWPIGTEEKSSKYLGITIGKRLEWKAHVDDIVPLSKPKHRQVQPLAASPYVDPAVVERVWEQKVPPCLLKGRLAGATQHAERSLACGVPSTRRWGRAPGRSLELQNNIFSAIRLICSVRGFVGEVVRVKLCDRSRSLFSCGFPVEALSFVVYEQRDIVLIDRCSEVSCEVVVFIMAKCAVSCHIFSLQLFAFAV